MFQVKRMHGHPIPPSSPSSLAHCCTTKLMKTLAHLGGIQDVGVRGHLDGLLAAAQAGRRSASGQAEVRR